MAMGTESDNNESSSYSDNSREASPPTAVFAKYIIIMIAAVALIGFFAIKPAITGYFDNNDKIDQQITKNKNNQETFDQLRAKQANLNSTQEEVDEFLNSFPSSADQMAMLNELQSIASSNGVDITSITPIIGTEEAAPTTTEEGEEGATGANPELVASIGLDMSLSGNDVNGFIEDLEEAERVFVVDSISYSSGGGEEPNTLTMSATTYVVPPLADPTVVEDMSGESAGPSEATVPNEGEEAPAPETPSGDQS